jgi:hypothetical protein
MAVYDVKVKVVIPYWVEWIAVWPVLAYRKMKYGYVFRRIRLTRGLWAIVDPEWYERLSKYKWHANMEGKGGKGYYATRMIRKGGKCIKIWVHKVVMGEVLRQYSGKTKAVVDHINRDKLDNRRVNLWIVMPKQNAWNSRRGVSEGSSKYKGVSWDNRAKKWRVMMCVNRKAMYFGCFDDELEAAKVYDRAAKKYQGKFAVLNFPSCGRPRQG